MITSATFISLARRMAERKDSTIGRFGLISVLGHPAGAGARRKHHRADFLVFVVLLQESVIASG